MFRTSIVCLALCAVVSTTANAQSGTYNQALNAYFANDHETADALLTIAIGDGSLDSRLYFYRGLARFASGEKDAAGKDFTYAAELEASGQSRGGSVDRALEKVQGAARRVLETHRREAKQATAIKAGFQKRGQALNRMYTRARTDYFAGKYEQAGLTLDQIITQYDSKDPRVYYFRGLCLQQLKRNEDAAEDFEIAVQLELSPGNHRINVDAALERVQGGVRIALESHRQELLSSLRQKKRLERQQMIAQLVQSRQGAVAAATAAPSSLTPGAGATTSPMPNPGTSPTAGTSTPPTPPTTPTTPSTTTTVNVAAGPTLDLTWIQADAEILLHFKVAEAWNSALLTPFHDAEGVAGFFDEMAAATGVQFNDIDSITAGVSKVDELAQTAAIAGPGALANTTDALVAVVRLQSLYDFQFLDAQTDLFEKADHNGTSYYRSLDGGQTPCIYLPDSKTLVLADQAVLEGMIETGPTAAQRPELAFLDTSRQLLIAFLPKDPAALTDQIPEEPTGSPGGDALIAAIKGKLEGVALGFGITDNFEIQLQLLGADETAAGDMNVALGQVTQELTGMWQLMKGAAPEPIQPVVDTLLRSLQTSSQGDVATLSARLSSQAIQRMVAAAQEMIPMMLGGMMAGGGPGAGPGPGGFGPGGLGDEPAEAPMATRPATPVQVTAKAKISDLPDFDDEANELPKAIELVIDIIGDDAKSANAWGFPVLTSATDNNGTDLALRDRSAFGSQSGFTDIDRDDFFVEHPDDGCQVAIAFEPPQNKADSIAAAEGMIKLRVVADSQDFEIANAASLLGKELTDSNLAGAGYKLTLSEKEEDFGDGLKVKMWKINWDNADAAKVDAMVDGGGVGLQAPVLVSSAGEVLQYFDGVEAVSFGPSAEFAWTMTLDPDNPPPADAKLRFTINNQVDYVDVKFTVQDVEIAESSF